MSVPCVSFVSTTKKHNMTTMIQMLLKELNQEAKTTQKMLALVPDDKHNWKPHEKSMALIQLASHIAELPGWVPMTITTSELDFSKNAYKPTIINSNAELLEHFNKSLDSAQTELAKTNDEQLLPNWTLRDGDTIFSVSTKAEVIRMTYCQIVHHRAQLGVYLRLLNIPIPGSYGPSADDASFH